MSSVEKPQTVRMRRVLMDLPITTNTDFNGIICLSNVQLIFLSPHLFLFSFPLRWFFRRTQGTRWQWLETQASTKNRAQHRSSMTVKFISVVLHGSKRQHLEVLQSQHAEQSSNKMTEKKKKQILKSKVKGAVLLFFFCYSFAKVVNTWIKVVQFYISDRVYPFMQPTTFTDGDVWFVFSRRKEKSNSPEPSTTTAATTTTTSTFSGLKKLPTRWWPA